MNVLFLAEGETPERYEYSKRIAKGLKEKSNNVIFACDSKYLVEAGFVDLSEFKIYYFDEWTDSGEEKRRFQESDISTEISYINFERLNCWGAKKSLNNYTRHIEKGIISQLIRFFLQIIEEEKINFVLYEEISNLFAYAAYEATKIEKIPYLGWIMSRIPGRFEFYTDPHENEDNMYEGFIKTSLDNIDCKEKEEINKYIYSIAIIKPDYMKNNPTDMKANYWKAANSSIFKAIKQLPILARADLKSSYFVRYPFEIKNGVFKYNALRKAKINVLKRKYDQIDYNDKYFIYPLHFQPEASTGVLAPYYCNQLEVIRCLAFSLPVGTVLYVKDHPNGIGFKKLSFYKEIFKLPNVKYIDPNANNGELIRNSLGVITITGTMGYEALLMEKPVITLGHVFYNAHPYCIHVSGYDEVNRAMKACLHDERENFHEYNVLFVKLYKDRTYQGRLFDFSEKSINEVTTAILNEADKESKKI